MTYRLGEPRVAIEVPDGPTVEVEPIGAWPIAFNVSRLIEAYNSATPGAAELVALRDLYATFVAEAQPSWDLADHRGPIPATATGMWRLPLPLAFGVIGAWLATLVPEASAVDEVIPEGPVRDALNRELRKSRRKST